MMCSAEGRLRAIISTRRQLSAPSSGPATSSSSAPATIPASRTPRRCQRAAAAGGRGGRRPHLCELVVAHSVGPLQDAAAVHHLGWGGGPGCCGSEAAGWVGGWVVVNRVGWGAVSSTDACRRAWVWSAPAGPCQEGPADRAGNQAAAAAAAPELPPSEAGSACQKKNTPIDFPPAIAFKT